MKRITFFLVPAGPGMSISIPDIRHGFNFRSEHGKQRERERIQNSVVCRRIASFGRRSSRSGSLILTANLLLQVTLITLHCLSLAFTNLRRGVPLLTLDFTLRLAMGGRCHGHSRGPRTRLRCPRRCSRCLAQLWRNIVHRGNLRIVTLFLLDVARTAGSHVTGLLTFTCCGPSLFALRALKQ